VDKLLAHDAHPLEKVVSFDTSKVDPTFIVGVVRDIPHQGLREKVAPTVYLPIAQRERTWGDILVRSALPASDVVQALSREVARLGPGVTNAQPRTIRQHIDESIFEDRLLAQVGGFFGGLALLLAALGLYGVVAYGIAWRTREIGIRLALGARRSVILRMAVADSFVLVVLGLALGLPVAFAAARAVSSLLFGVKPADVSTFAATAGALLVVALAAAFVPARRALSIQPVQVLRHE
jgi:putative ABC transport system permease protein